MLKNAFFHLATQVGELLRSNHLMLATAESCTGGEIGYLVTSVQGSSNWFDRGFVTYSNQSKQEMLGISLKMIKEYGTVSEIVARAMAEGALQHSHADVSLAVTGIAGPDGGTPEKPVGTVWFAWAGKKFETYSVCKHFHGDRTIVRDQSALTALSGLISFVERREPKQALLEEEGI